MSEFPKTGQIFDNRFHILSPLGEGGVGAVFKARQVDVDRLVALKILHPALSQDEEFRDRFLREAQTLHKLPHANIVNVYSLGVAGSGQMYLTMELVQGKSARQLLAESGRFSTKRALKIIRDAARALEYVHENGVIHRDLKPENMIILDKPEPDTIKLIDFGMARVLDVSSQQKLTQTGELLGTATYMSPEQCQGLKVDKRSDIYSLGACLYELLTGEKCFKADTSIGMMYQQVNTVVPPITVSMVECFDPSLNQIIAKAMNKKPDLRYQSMAEMAGAVDQALEQLDLGVPKKNYFIPYLLSAVCVCVVLGVGLLVARGKFANAPKAVAASSRVGNESATNPEKVRIPRKLKDLLKLVGEYTPVNSTAVETIYTRWLSKYGDMADSEERAQVIANLAVVYADLGKVTDAESFAHTVFMDKAAKPQFAYVAGHLADLYCKIGQPHNGVVVIESTLSMNPDLLKTDEGIGLLNREGLCYLKLFNYAQAESVLKRGEKIEQELGMNSIQKNKCTYLLISILCKEGKKKQAFQVIRDCISSLPGDQFKPDSRKATLNREIGNALYEGEAFLDGDKFLEEAKAEFLQLGDTGGADNCTQKQMNFWLLAADYKHALKFELELLGRAKNQLERAATLEKLSQLACQLRDSNARHNYGQQSLDCCFSLFNSNKGAGSREYNQCESSVLNMSSILLDERKPSEAANLLSDWIERLRTTAPSQSPSVALLQEQCIALCIAQRWQDGLNCSNKEIQFLLKSESNALSPIQHNEPQLSLSKFYLLKGMFLKNLERQEEAAVAVGQFHACFKGDKKSTQKQKIVMLRDMGRILGNENQISEANDCYALALPLILNMADGEPLKVAEWLLDIARFKIERENFAEAEKIYRECLRKIPQSQIPAQRTCLLELSKVLLLEKKWSDAHSVLDQLMAISQESNLKDSIYYQMLEYQRQSCNGSNDWRGGLRYMDKYVSECRPEYFVVGYENLAQSYDHEKDYPSALGAIQTGLDRVRKENPSDVYSQCFFIQQLGDIKLSCQHKYAEAEQLFRTSIKLAASIQSKEKRDEILSKDYKGLAQGCYSDNRFDDCSRFFKESAQFAERNDEKRLILSFWLSLYKESNRSSEVKEIEEMIRKLPPEA